MTNKLIRKQFRSFKRWWRNKKIVLLVIGAFLLVCILVYDMYMQNRRLTVDPTTYTQLLQLIARVESKGNYNAYFGNAGNSSIDFTSMSVAEVMAWQEDYVRQGSPSSAVGRYQIVHTTLSELIRQLGIDPNQRFDKALQDRLAIALIERRGAENYVNATLTREQFAANLAKEWAALPKVIGENPSESYYASDGLNRSLVSVEEVLKAIQPITSK